MAQELSGGRGSGGFGRAAGEAPRRRRRASEESVAGRVPPHDLEAEKAVLSALLLDNGAIHAVLTEVKPEDFYHPAHQQLYQAMVSLQDENQPVDLHTLSDFLRDRKLLDAVGGAAYLGEISDYESTAANVVHHAKIVREKAVKRSLIAVTSEIAESVYEDPDDAGLLLDVAQARIFEIGQSKNRSTFSSLHAEVDSAIDYVEHLLARGGELTGCPTGFKDLDEKTGGLQPGELVIIAARPSMGKTALALNMARNAAVDHGKRVAIFSLEMTKRALTLRLLASEARVDFSSFRRGFGSTGDHAALVRAAGRLSEAAIWIDDTGMITVLEIKAKCRRLARERDGLDLVLVDYLQLAHGDSKNVRKDLEIAEISHGLKALAKELNIPVIALSQLNRGPEQRDPDKRRPNMGDLRESGAIEQDADVIAFIYRDEVYNPNEENRGLAELIIAKQRNGPTGTVKLQFEGRYANFRDLAEEPPGGFGPPPFAPEDGFGPGSSGRGSGGGFDGEPAPRYDAPHDDDFGF
jgi:replicative DNA helicase